MGRVDRSECDCYGHGSNNICGNPTWRNCLCTSICAHCGERYCTRKGAHCDIHTSLKYAENGDPQKLTAYDQRTKRERKKIKDHLKDNAIIETKIKTTS